MAGRHAGIAGQEGGEVVQPEIGQGHLAHGRILQEIVRAGAALQPGTENQHLHGVTTSNKNERSQKFPGQSPGT